ncbi:hypothetical protein [Cyprinid herpesvirus 3]|uniref:Uncharacterized protein n=1 Tax=Cyprinid herpesvirus 3 TaxID=180230 RepID=A4FTB3_CYHV3|nr:hypothetical protein [Cyprinid herpesvirus 3]BAF48987.1 hypothetical protein [Cyprinid herpesvirus 3]
MTMRGIAQVHLLINHNISVQWYSTTVASNTNNNSVHRFTCIHSLYSSNFGTFACQQLLLSQIAAIIATKVRRTSPVHDHTINTLTHLNRINYSSIISINKRISRVINQCIHMLFFFLLLESVLHLAVRLKHGHLRLRHFRQRSLGQRGSSISFRCQGITSPHCNMRCTVRVKQASTSI